MNNCKLILYAIKLLKLTSHWRNFIA